MQKQQVVRAVHANVRRALAAVAAEAKVVAARAANIMMIITVMIMVAALA